MIKEQIEAMAKEMKGFAIREVWISPADYEILKSEADVSENKIYACGKRLNIILNEGTLTIR